MTANLPLSTAPVALDAPAADPTRAYSRPLSIRHGRIDAAHGAGGKAAMQLIEELFLAAFDNEALRQGDDGAVLALPAFDPTQGRLVMATDGHVISPLFFPGGDIGSLAVNGTLNDVAMMGAQPLYLSASFILEEGGGPATHRVQHGGGGARGRGAHRHGRHQGGRARQG